MAQRRTDGAGPLLLALVGAGAVVLVALKARATEPRREPSPPPPPAPRPPSPSNPVPYTDKDVEAVARVIVSEKGDGTLDERTWIAWTVRNRAAKRGVSPFELESPWGEQLGKRPFSSRQEATPRALELARQVLQASRSSDPTGGATSFWEPGLQDKLVRLGELYRSDPMKHAKYERFKHYKTPAAEVRAKWLREGQRIVGTVGDLEFLK